MTTTTKHGLNSNGIVESFEMRNGGDIHIVSQPKGFEFMVCDNEGRTLKFSDEHYPTLAWAMKDAVLWYCDNE